MKSFLDFVGLRVCRDEGPQGVECTFIPTKYPFRRTSVGIKGHPALLASYLVFFATSLPAHNNKQKKVKNVRYCE